MLLPRILCGGAAWAYMVVCKPILVFSLNLSQAEQFGSCSDPYKLKIYVGKDNNALLKSQIWEI